jgi:hypothetical protein
VRRHFLFRSTLGTHKKRVQRWGVPDELWVKKAVKISIHNICPLFSKKHARSVGCHPPLVTNYVAVEAALL